MDAKRNADYLRRVAGAVQKFIDEFEIFMRLHVDTTESGFARGLLPALTRQDGISTEEIDTQARRVSMAAGLAGEATGLTHGYVAFNGQPIDPIAAWRTPTNPKPILEAKNILDVATMMIGRLNAMADKAEAGLDTGPDFGVGALHPIIWGAARSRWQDGYPEDAVQRAAEALVNHVRTITGRRDVEASALWQETFSDRKPQPGKPRLRWPGDSTHLDVKSMNDGLRGFSAGVQKTIRNPTSHPGEDQLDVQGGLERLATLSLLARWVEQCSLETVDDETGVSSQPEADSSGV